MTTQSLRGAYIRENYLPDYYYSSDITADLFNSVGLELDVFFQLVNRILDESFILTSSSYLLEYWENMFGIPIVTSDSDELRIARILSYTIVRQRSRKTDIASLVRSFLSGPKAYALQQYTATRSIRVSSTTGFAVNDVVYVGTIATAITAIDTTNKILSVNPAVNVYAYQAISKNKVEIAEQYADYTFTITVTAGTIEDNQSIIDAVERAKPAHLGWQLYETVGLLGLFNDPESLLNDPTIGRTITLIYDNT